MAASWSEGDKERIAWEGRKGVCTGHTSVDIFRAVAVDQQQTPRTASGHFLLRRKIIKLLVFISWPAFWRKILPLEKQNSHTFNGPQSALRKHEPRLRIDASYLDLMLRQNLSFASENLREQKNGHTQNEEKKRHAPLYNLVLAVKKLAIVKINTHSTTDRSIDRLIDWLIIFFLTT